MPNQLATPDPILSSEGIGAFVVTLVANAYILFGSSLDNGRQTALATVITSLYVVFTLVHAAIVRKGRAQSTHPLDSFNPQPEYPPEDLKVVPE